MKNISFNIPTSISDVKMMWKGRVDKRYKHNRKVVIEMYNKIISEMKSNYWSNDVTDYFRQNFTYTGDMRNVLIKALKELE